MFSTLPVLYENQTLYSWCGLTHALNGGVSSRATSINLFGTPYAALCHDFPSRLTALDQSTQGALGCPRTIALRNTLLGYYLSIVCRPRATQILGLLQTGTVRHLKTLLGITASRVGGHHPIKGCVKCFAEDEASQGWAYWHVEHQPPSVFVCTKHYCPLAIAWDPVTPLHRRHWLLPRHAHHYKWVEISVQDDAAMQCLLRLATDSSRLMDLPPASLAPEQLTFGYQNIMRAAGLATRSGNLRTRDLVSLIKNHYKGLGDLPGMGPLRSIDDHWPGLAASLSRRSSRPGHPLKHLLLIGAISRSWDEFYDACATRPSFDRAMEPADASEITADDLLSRFKGLVTVHGDSLASASRSLGISKSTGSFWAKKLRIAYRSRGVPITTSTETTIKQMLVNGDSIENISAEAGVSKTTVYRISGTNQAIRDVRKKVLFDRHRETARRSFSETSSAQSEQTLRVIRATPGSSYMWLYRNDHNWLSRKLAEQGRVSSRSR